MVVDDDDVGARQLQRPATDLARIDRSVIDGAPVLYLVQDELVLVIHIECHLQNTYTATPCKR